MDEQEEAVDASNIKLFRAKELRACCLIHQEVIYTGRDSEESAFQLTSGYVCSCCSRSSAQVSDAAGTAIGSIQYLNFCYPIFRIRDARDQVVLEAKAACQLGHCCPFPVGPCAERDFPITDRTTGEKVGNLKRKSADVAPFGIHSHLDFEGVALAQNRALLVAMATFFDAVQS